MDNEKKIFYRKVLKRFSIFFLIAVVVIVIIAIVTGAIWKRQRLKEIEFYYGNYINISNEYMYLFFDHLIGELLYLTELDYLKDQQYKDSVKYEHLIITMKQFSKVHKNFAQVRFLDKQGLEIIRIDKIEGKPVSIDKHKLQDKSDRYYFQNSINLDEKEFYLSPIDLNVENGEIEVPYNPVLRVCAPVYSSDGKASGVVVINYQAADFIEKLRLLHEYNNLFKTTFFMTNSDGFFLYSDREENNWSFMFPAQEQKTLQKRFVNEGEKIFSQKEGSFYSGKNLFVFYTIEVSNFLNSNRFEYHSSSESNNKWKIIVSVSESEISKELNHLTNKVIHISHMIMVLLLIPGIAFSFLSVKNSLYRKELYFHANYDALTGFYNRSYGLNKLNHDFHHHFTDSNILTVIFVDINNLKLINDEFGHAEGDRLIAFVAKLVLSNIRKADYALRLGGDEFLIVLPGASADSADIIKRRLKGEMGELSKSMQYSIGASFGVAVNNENVRSAGDLIRLADERMYVEKKSARKF